MKARKITDVEIKGAFGDCFLSCSMEEKKKVLAECLLKIFCGYSDSATAVQISQKLKLMTQKGTITKHGKEYLIDFYYKPKS